MTRKGIGCMSNLRKQAEAVAQSICDNDGFLQSEHIDLIEAFGQQMQEEEREALVAMIQDDKGYPRQPQYSALNGWWFIVEAIRARGGKP